MGKHLKWQDFIIGKAYNEKGNIAIFRNYVTLNDENEITLQYPLIPGTLNCDPLLFEAIPIASGITAFFHMPDFLEPSLYDHTRNGTNCSISLLYERYYRKVLDQFSYTYNMIPKPLSIEDTEVIFRPLHIEAEKMLLQESEKYYSECVDERDLLVKSQLKNYVFGYIEWVTELHNSAECGNLFNSEDESVSYILIEHEDIQDKKGFANADEEKKYHKKRLSDILDPLILANFTKGKQKKNIFCIDTSFKMYLEDCFLELYSGNEWECPNTPHIIYYNPPFYNAVTIIQDTFSFETQDVIRIIADALGRNRDNLSKGSPDSIRTELSKARTRRIKLA